MVRSGFKRVRRGRFRQCKPYTGLPRENRGRAINSWMKSAEFRQGLDRSGRLYFASMLARAFS
jgi:hypothetical protein